VNVGSADRVEPVGRRGERRSAADHLRTYDVDLMKTFFLQTAVANLALLLLVIGWGHVQARSGEPSAAFDVLVVLVATFSVLVHSIVYTYFIASGKFFETAVEEHGYPDPTVVEQAKENKRKAFRFAFLAMFAVVVTAGLWFASSPVRQDLAISRWWPAISAWIAILVSLHATRKEWFFLGRNLALADDVLDTVTRIRDAAAPRPASDRAG